MQQDHRGADRLSIWMKGGDSWYPNYVGLVERNGCLKLLLVLPGTSAIMAGVLDKLAGANQSLEQLLVSGKIPAYFYPFTEVCNP